jgi:hypothetical protein
VAAAGQELLHRLGAIEQELIEPRVQAPLDMEHYPTRLNIKLASRTSVVASADAAPAQQAYDVFADLSARIEMYRPLTGSCATRMFPPLCPKCYAPLIGVRSLTL